MTPWKNFVKTKKQSLFNGHIIRFLKIRKYFSSHAIRKIQIAPGELPVKKEGWLTADIYTGDIYLDATRKLPFPDNSIDYIFSEHFLEHLNFASAIRHLNEIYEVIKPKGVVRISVPNLEKLVDVYIRKDEDLLKSFLDLLRKIVPDDEKPIFQRRKRMLPAEFINVNFYGFDHYFMWDFEIFDQVLKVLGFSNIKQFKERESNIPELRNLERHSEMDPLNPQFALNIQATKPYKKIRPTSELLQTVEYFLKKKPPKGRS